MAVLKWMFSLYSIPFHKRQLIEALREGLFLLRLVMVDSKRLLPSQDDNLSAEKRPWSEDLRMGVHRKYDGKSSNVMRLSWVWEHSGRQSRMTRV